ncbi:hypothetical protein [Phorcysia thermohydrogeniphila]|uniref:Uncharacterized protein n=1 Tax=Phorcysia thermohydrogeniphila TaxID=936138 RepID=A0A4R1GHK9_9BACT|nr:hypothetical protein [Phorcysia thermohydrogeniphila]TCK06215.1 hypothetical protein CLV27_0016 [Phorcysia thermohydrogeniphila]
MELKDFLEEYKRALSMLREDRLKVYSIKAPEEIKEGFVYETEYEGAPVLLLVANLEEHFAEVVPLSFSWELATRYDYILEFEHPLRDTWIAQLDLATEVPKEILFQLKERGKIKEEDLRIIQSVLADEGEIPEEKRGRGYEDEVHKEFKRIEFERHRWLYEALLLSLDEEEERLVIVKPLREELEELSSLLLAADATQNVVNLPFGKLIYVPEEKKAELLLDEKFLGKTGKLSVSINGKEFTLFVGKLSDITILSVTEKLFRALKHLTLKVKEGE